ncbi:MAG: NAD(P)(+) transhydrogenase (Re/Si-specific) subunit beta [Planctomycetes bacterium]|nr:NAD(P)(+) transhydrogenase (Re/Si-specific) subunit beta [Planctomycetota bacterium]MCB9935078.1 NAD(P)(+) transhydrogenase (Re/Si-specific) subunit beta [Planctomycetota bacterium]
MTGPVSPQVLAANAGYLASVLMFMFGIMRMGKVKTARSGNQLAAGAMLLAMVSQFVEMGRIEPWFIVAGIVIGSVVGVVAAIKVEMTEMPEMVALFNGSGGLASALVALAAYAFHHIPMQPLMSASMGEAAPSAVNGLAVMLSIVIGCVTFTGSLIAFGKLSGKVSGSPVLLPGRHVINAALLIMSLGGSVMVVFTTGGMPGMGIVIAVTVMALILGVMLVIPIGGGDMPVVISLLNSYSGLAAAMAGFAINSQVLIVSGSLVGAAGLILTQIMCKAMNRSLTNVLFGGFGAEPEAGGKGGGADEYTNVKSAEAEEVAMILEDVQSLIFVPGYGMAVSQAQHLVRELGDMMAARGCQVRYAIHPVAGRMPGHMNVLLAEASVPYEQLFELDQINNEFKATDAVIVIGANDVVNPDAVNKKDSPLYGMPVLNVWEARTCFVIKRSLSPGFAMVKNPLFEADNNYMVFGDGRKALEEIIKCLKEA